jgi:hypothetical protein
LENIVLFPSIAAAARYISGFTSTTPRSIASALEKRILSNSLEPYLGFSIAVDKEGN